MIPATPMQQKALEIIRAANMRGMSPSVGELGEALGLKSKSGVHRLLVGLRQRGRVTWQPNMPRSMRVIGEPLEAPDLLALLDRLSIDQLRDVITRATILIGQKGG